MNVPHEDAFMITFIGIHPLIFGMLFLKCTDIFIKWKEQTIHFFLDLKPICDS